MGKNLKQPHIDVVENQLVGLMLRQINRSLRLKYNKNDWKLSQWDNSI